jgi:citrate lyase beta subunit
VDPADSPSTDQQWIAKAVYERVGAKLKVEAIEDHRVDFEDGYGSRADDEEDAHAESAARAMAEGLHEGSLPAFVGIRIKALTEEAKHRSLRTLQIFLSVLMQEAGRLPDNFVVTLPKVTSAAQVSGLVKCLDLIEERLGIAEGSIAVELMIETIQSILSPAGVITMPALVDAGAGRVSSAILGTFDYTASCNIASTFQDHMHPAADFARNIMQVSLTGTEVTLCDGITNIMPVPVHRLPAQKASADRALSEAQIEENHSVVHAAWRIHFNNIMHSLRLGFYQGWDLNPAQVPIRYAAVYYFFLTGLNESVERLKTFIDKAAQASMVGNTFDDAATGQGLVNYFVNGINCGALTEAEALATGITLAELQQRSFLKIVENRA